MIKLLEAKLYTLELKISELNRITSDQNVSEDNYQTKLTEARAYLPTVIHVLESLSIDDKSKAFKMVEDFLIRVELKRDPLLAFLFPGIGRSLRRFTDYKTKKPRKKGIDPKERKFARLVPKLDLNSNWLSLQVKLKDEFKLKIGRTALLGYIEKYRSR